MMQSQKDAETPWYVGDLALTGRVLLGSAEYPSRQVFMDALAAADPAMVTVSLRRVPVAVSCDTQNLYAQLKKHGHRLLPNTAGCFSAQEAILTAQMAREALQTPLIKLEVIADDETLLPDPFALLQAATTLVREGFVVLPYTNDDPILARRLQDVGCAAVMPLAAPIGTGLGIRNPHALEMIVAQSNVPVIVDAGLGTASDVALAMELGADAVLLNSAVARAQNPVAMAKAIRLAAEAGYLAKHSGRMAKRHLAHSASPLQGRAWRAS